MTDLNTCSNEKLSFKYNDKWELEAIPLENNPDCIATLSYEDGSLLNVIAFPSELESLDIFKEVVEASLRDDGAEIVSSEIANVNKRPSIQIHSKVTTPEISFQMFSVIFLEEGFLYIFELRAVSEIVHEFMEIVKSFEILE
ncbi:hypothetical protein mru_0730 [Methanobrevibacter ruminantium M1]|uniref:Uncharacterized protein n=1 Tax=Methanobrevibacter ruminantium (strain ATCC 35063 / DSM 1093 / JCM 13430 / OCM 146 / M1) TaxID=634498 RepID=D3E220_METRM|nr:hypothetical protein [Methanobrevibacter ruminantium]ADC46581.1 hypothetical protein mru_0730 [Methanobrevibacter ruminantium M1]